MPGNTPESTGRSGSQVQLPIYLDNHATTPVDPRVLEAMLPFLSNKFGNAASHSHQFGWEAGAAVENARTQIARLIGASPREIVFTSGATESDNLALRGVAEACKENARGNHIITVVTEHKAVLDTCHHLEKTGFTVTYLPVGGDGLIDLNLLKDNFTPKTILVSVMAANNEIGVLQPMREIGRLCREHGALFHSDAVQALGKVPLDVGEMSLDLASLTAHKNYGPKGCGGLYVRSGVRVSPMIDGGGHEHGMRSGTLNVPGIAGFGKACEISHAEMAEESCRIAGLRNRLRDRLQTELGNVAVNGSMEHRLPGNLNISFLDVEGEMLMTSVNDVAVSSGSACSSDKVDLSHVLKALGLNDERITSAIRFGIGRFNTEAEIDYVAGRVVEAVKALREVSAL
jgi:cysteine desulfurase